VRPSAIPFAFAISTISDLGSWNQVLVEVRCALDFVAFQDGKCPPLYLAERNRISNPVVEKQIEDLPNVLDVFTATIRLFAARAFSVS
jgi:hypothetical protein